MASDIHIDKSYSGGAEPRASERSFGLVFAVVFAVVAFLPLLKQHEPRWWAFAVAVAFAILAFAAPRLLVPLNTVWMMVGKVMHRVVSPVMLGFLFVIAVIPTSLFLRLTRADPLRLKFDRAARSYWQTRDNTIVQSFKNQF
jgi:predicted membrane metal-binding protein